MENQEAIRDDDKKTKSGLTTFQKIISVFLVIFTVQSFMLTYTVIDFFSASKTTEIEKVQNKVVQENNSYLYKTLFDVVSESGSISWTTFEGFRGHPVIEVKGNLNPDLIDAINNLIRTEEGPLGLEENVDEFVVQFIPSYGSVTNSLNELFPSLPLISKKEPSKSWDIGYSSFEGIEKSVDVVYYFLEALYEVY